MPRTKKSTAAEQTTKTVYQYKLSCSVVQEFEHQNTRISCSRDIANFLRVIWEPGSMSLYERFYVVFLSKANNICGFAEVSSGGQAGTVVDVKQLFVRALMGNAAAIIVSHNHPSGNLQPSQADIDLTKRIVQAGKILDMPVLDHIIISEYKGYYSFADEGMM